MNYKLQMGHLHTSEPTDLFEYCCYSSDDQEADTDGSGVLDYSQFKNVRPNQPNSNPPGAGFSTALCDTLNCFCFLPTLTSLNYMLPTYSHLSQSQLHASQLLPDTKCGGCRVWALEFSSFLTHSRSSRTTRARTRTPMHTHAGRAHTVHRVIGSCYLDPCFFICYLFIE